MLIKELKEILEGFEDDKSVSVFLSLTPKFGKLYDIEDWGDNNGHLDLWIKDSISNLKKDLISH